MLSQAELLRDLPAPLVLLVIGLLVTAEAALLIGVFLPGSSALLALGCGAYLGVVPIVPAVLTGTLAAMAGAHAGFASGRRFGPPAPSLHVRRPWLRLAVRRASALSRYSAALAIGQWLVGVRTLVPRLAGADGLSYRAFAARNAPSAACWGAGLVLAGYLAGNAVTYLAPWLGLGGVAVVGGAVGLVLLVRRLRRRASRVAATAG